MNYRPKSFILQELVAPTIFDRLGEDAWTLFDENALRALQALRDRFGALTVNDWHRGGTYRESGLREQNTTTGAPKSAHKSGKAFDCKFRDVLLKDVYAAVTTRQDEFPLIRRVENIKFARTWLHVDTVEHPGKGIRIFRP